MKAKAVRLQLHALAYNLRIPTMPATYSDLKAATYSDPMPAGVPI